jgi:hypothetical protein
MSGGGAFLYPGSEGQHLAFNDTSNTISSRSIRYRWTGENVAGQFLFAGFDLMHTPTEATYSSTAGRDLHAAGYGHVKFFARGSLATNTLAKIEVADDGNTSTVNLSCVSLSTAAHLDDGFNPGSTMCGRRDTISSDWHQYSIPISNPPVALASIKDFFKVTFVFNNAIPGNTLPGQGGTIYIDQIQYRCDKYNNFFGEIRNLIM